MQTNKQTKNPKQNKKSQTNWKARKLAKFLNPNNRSVLSTLSQGSEHVGHDSLCLVADESPGTLMLCVLNKAIKQGRKVTVLLSDNPLLHQELFLQPCFRRCELFSSCLFSSCPSTKFKKTRIFLSFWRDFKDMLGPYLHTFFYATKNSVLRTKC